VRYPILAAVFLVFWGPVARPQASTQAQVQVTYPTERMVFQRDANNQATVLVGGYYAPPVDKIEARFVPLNGGTETPWTLIEANPKGGVYQGRMTLTGGWYRLEVRASFQNAVVANGRQEHVGVGEVFLIMGHSNAQGGDGYGPSQPAQDDRVNSADLTKFDFGAYNQTADPNFMSRLDFNQLCQTCSIAPYSFRPWFWSQLGDRLVQRLNVPVLFYSAAFGGTNMEQNYKAIKRIPFEWFGSFQAYNIGFPYSNLRNALWRYVPSTGLRAVLALHGENDFGSAKNDVITYYQTTIEQSRIDANQPSLAWMVAISSFKGGRTDPNVTDAQRAVIATVPNVFPGPNADDNPDPAFRLPDQLHYSVLGQTEMARRWDNALTDSFFVASTPVLPVLPPTISVACNGNNRQVLSASGAYANYFWTNNDQGVSTVPPPGLHQVTVRSDRGLYWFSPAVRVPEQVGPPRPVLQADGPTSFCPGGRVTLTGGSPSATRYQWSTGPTDTRLTVSTQGTYRLRAFDNVNCFSESSQDVVVFPEPAKPTVVAQGSTFFCDTLNVVLAATSAGADSAYTWNAGPRVRNLTVNQSGEYRVRGLNRFGCFSPESDPLRVTVVPTPEAPVVERVGPFTLQASNQRRVTQYDWRIDNGALATQGPLFKTPRDGRYQVRAYLDSAQAGGAPIRCFSRFSQPYSVTLEANDGFVVYPVPSSDGYVTLDTREVWNNLNVSVITGDGKVIFQQTYPTFDGRLRLYLGPTGGKFYIHVRGQNLSRTKTALVP